MCAMSPRLLRPIASGVHPEAADWRARVIANGGTVSGSTLQAVSRFCASISAAGIRDRFYRLGIFAGNSDASLNAVRTPLFRGPSRTGTQYGGTTDTNNNFVAGDYAENNGLLGNGSTKWLNTELDLNGAGLTTAAPGMHMSAVTTAYTIGANVNNIMVAAVNAAVNQRFWVVHGSNNVPTTEVTSQLGFGSATGAATKQIAATNGAAIPGGLWLVSRSSHTDIRLYNGAVEEASSVGDISGGPNVPTNPMTVFVRWNGSAFFGFVNQRIRAYSVGLSMTAQQVSDFNTAMAALQTALGRT